MSLSGPAGVSDQPTTHGIVSVEPPEFEPVAQVVVPVPIGRSDQLYVPERRERDSDVGADL